MKTLEGSIYATVPHALLLKNFFNTVGKGSEMARMKSVFACIIFFSMFLCGLSVLAQTAGRPLSSSERARIAEARKLEELSNAKYQEGKYDDACDLARQVLDIYETIYGPDHRDVSISLVNLAHMYNYRALYNEAEKLLVRAVRIDEKTLGANDKGLAVTLNNLGELYLKQGKIDKAEPLLLRSVNIMESNLGKEHPDVGFALANLASAMEIQGKYREAESVVKRALAISEKTLGADHVDTAIRVKQLAGLQQSIGDYASAERGYLRAKSTIERTLGLDHPTLSGILNDLGGMYVDLGNYSAAKPLLERSLRISEDSLGTFHPLTATIVCNLATLYMSEGDHKIAESMYRRAYGIFGQELGQDHLKTAACAERLGTLKVYQRNFDSAEQFLSGALKSFERGLDPNNPEIGNVAYALGGLRVRMGNLRGAEPLLLRSLAIVDKSLPSDHPILSSRLTGLAILNDKLNKDSEADVFFDRGRHATQRYISAVLPSLSENEQTKFIEERFTSELFAALSFGLKHAESSVITRNSASWLINGKAVALQSLAQRNLLSRDTEDPGLASVVKQLQQVRGELARISMAKSTSAQMDSKKELFAKLVNQEQMLSKQLALASGSVEQEGWIDVGKIRTTLPPNVSFIDFARFDLFDFSAVGAAKTWRPARYAAWITQGGDSGNTVVVDLGDADEIDTLVKDVCNSIPKGISQVTAMGEVDATAVITRDLAILADRIWRPLESVITQMDSEISDIVLSPDGNLWVLPWACLPLPEEAGKVLLEKYTVRFVTSGRDLLSTPMKVVNSKTYIFADPSFDQTGDEKRRSIEAVFRQPLVAGEEVNRDKLVSLLPKVTSLPGTGIEAALTIPSIETWAGTKPAVFQQRYALERVAKALRHPKLVSFATHGFYLPIQKVDRELSDIFAMSSTRSIAIDKTGSPVENPLLRCGLLFSGCNTPSSIVGDDDGILTGLEIVGIDLRGTELVVLSACETGVGEVRNGEGIAGLRQAFQLAGAQSVVSSLWQVPDRESAQIMIDFFSNLAAGQTRAASLRKAQLKMIAARKEFLGAAHPYYWAAWTLTGHDN